MDMLKLAWYELKAGAYNPEGRFFMHDGKAQPSKTYLESHELPDFITDEWYNKNYHVEDDAEVFLEKRICRECGTEFLLPDALVEFQRACPNFSLYARENIGDVCGRCAAKDLHERFPDAML